MLQITDDEFINFVKSHKPYGFDNDIKNIQTTLKNEYGKELLKYEDILKYMLDNIELNVRIGNISMKFHCYDWLTHWLNDIEDQNKNVPNIGFDTTDILIAIIAFTGTGISWIIWSLCDRNPYHDPISKFVIGVINILVSGLFACSIFFGWVLAVQIMLGILFSWFAIFTVVMTIYNTYKKREVRRKDNESHREYMSNRIHDMKEYLKQVKRTSEQDKSDKQNKSNDKIKGEADNQNNNFPDSQKFENENDKKK